MFMIFSHCFCWFVSRWRWFLYFLMIVMLFWKFSCVFGCFPVFFPCVSRLFVWLFDLILFYFICWLVSWYFNLIFLCLIWTVAHLHLSELLLLLLWSNPMMTEGKLKSCRYDILWLHCFWAYTAGWFSRQFLGIFGWWFPWIWWLSVLSGGSLI